MGDRSSELTTREKQVFELLMLGQANKEIAAELGMSPRTVKFHIANVFEKRKVHSRGELLAREYRAFGDDRPRGDR